MWRRRGEGVEDEVEVDMDVVEVVGLELSSGRKGASSFSLS